MYGQQPTYQQPGQPQQQPWPGGYVQQPAQQPGGWPQAAPQSQPQGDPFQDPSRGGGAAPSARHLEGRTIIVVPHRVDETSKFKDAVRPTAYLDLFVLDGGPMQYGDNADLHTPPTHQIQTPCHFANIMMGNSGIVNEVRDLLRRGGMSVGVVQRGQKGNRPYLITKVETDLDGNTRPDGAQRRELARNIYFAHTSGSWQSPEPLLLQPAGPLPGSVNYANAATPWQAAQMASAHLDSVVNAQYGPPAGQQPPAPNPYPQQSQPTGDAGYPPPPGWDPGQWANFSPADQLRILQANGAQQQQPGVTTPPPGRQQYAQPAAPPPGAYGPGPGM